MEACRSQSSGTSPEACSPVPAALPATGSADGLAGEYRLSLVASSGPRKDGAVEGALWLEPQDSSRRYRTGLGGRVDSTILHPLRGGTDVDLSRVYAVSVGRTDSRDPEQPGVLVIERHARSGKAPQTEITMRLGSDANRAGQVRFDGGYTALRVRKVGPAGFAGSWASGLTGERAGGYFCATRVKSRK
jgi:hypothetical protein